MLIDQIDASTLRCDFYAKPGGSGLRRVIKFTTLHSPAIVSMACMMHEGKLYFWASDNLDEPSVGSLPKTIQTGGDILRIGHAASATDQAPFIGMVFMVRLWNNLSWLKAALQAETPAWGLSADTFPDF